MDRDTLKANLALLIVAVIYGLNYIIAKDVMQGYIQPFGFIVIRVIGATALFWIFFGKTKDEKIKPQDFIRLFFCGVFGVAINQLLFFKGISITSPINASIIMTLNPVIVFGLSLFFLKEALSPIRLLGIVIGFMGAVTIFMFKRLCLEMYLF